MGLFLELYMEEKILYDKDVSTDYKDINKIKLIDTQHSRTRQHRSDQKGRTTDTDIINTVSKIENDIINDYISHTIPRKGNIHIVNNNTKLNIILAYSFISHNEDTTQDKNKIRLKMTIVTDMIKKKFKYKDVEKSYSITK